MQPNNPHKRKDPFKRATLAGTSDFEYDDLLEVQEDFSRRGIEPSATVVNPKRTEEPPQKKPKQSLFAQRNSKKKANDAIFDNTTPLVMTGQVIERDTSNFVPQMILPPTKTESGFPSLTPNINLARKKVEPDTKMDIKEVEVDVKYSPHDNSEEAAIDRDSDRMLSNMSQDEIAQERERLLAQLDPQLIERLKQLGLNKKKVPQKAPMKPEDDLRMRELLTGNNLEEEKRKWMDDSYQQTPIEEEHANLPRYDFDGVEIDASKGYSSHSGLYHHGSEPDRPGYNIVEMAQLMRSTLASQRALNMHILARVIRNYKKQHGYRKYVLELYTPLVTKYEILNALVSIGLVDKNVTAIQAAVELLYQLLSNEDDEKMFLRYDETVNMSGEKEDSTDDLIQKLFESSVLESFLVIIGRSSTLQESSTIDELVIKILHYFARHSLTMAQNVVKAKGLLGLLSSRYLSGTISHVGVLLIQLVRHLSMQGPSIFAQCDQQIDLIQLFRRNVIMLHELYMENGNIEPYFDVCTELLRTLRTVALYEDRIGQEIGDSLTRIMTIIGMPVTLIGNGSPLADRSFELAAAGCDLLSSAMIRLHAGHMREFVENDLSRLIKIVYGERTTNARYLAARALHLCASTHEQVGITEDHKTHLIVSVSRVDNFIAKLLTTVATSSWLDECIQALTTLDDGNGSSTAEKFEGPLYFVHYEPEEHYDFERETAIDGLYAFIHTAFAVANMSGKVTNEIEQLIKTIAEILTNNLSGLISRDKIRRNSSKLYRFFMLRRYLRPAMFVLQYTRFGDLLEKQATVQLALYVLASLLPGRVRGDQASAHWIARNIVLNESMYNGVRLHRFSQYVLLDRITEQEQQQPVPSYNLQHGVLQCEDVDLDWIFSGIEYSYAADRLEEEYRAEAMVVELVSQNLEFICALEPYGYIQVIPLIVRFANMSKVFMIENDIFFKEEVRAPLQKWIDQFAQQRDVTSLTSGLATNQVNVMSTRFFSMFEHFVGHYMAVSYHHATFACYLLVVFSRMELWESKYRIHIVNEVAMHQIVKLFEHYKYATIGNETDSKVLAAYVERHFADPEIDTTTRFFNYAADQVAETLFDDVEFASQMLWSDLLTRVKRVDVLQNILSRTSKTDEEKNKIWVALWKCNLENKNDIVQAAVYLQLPWVTQNFE
jgi:hypothetical protein